MKNNNNRLIYTGALLAATLTFGQVVQAESLILGGSQTISTDTTVESVVVGNSGTGPTGGDGSLTVNNGATLMNSGDGNFSGQIGGVNYWSGSSRIGLNAGSAGIATVSGAGSHWDNAGDLDVGWYGEGTLNVENGGKVTNVNGSIGFVEGSFSTVTVHGQDSLWQNSNTLMIGGSGGSGMLHVYDGGKVTSKSAFITGNDDLDSTVAIIGSGSSWSNTSSMLHIGDGDGRGVLIVDEGGQVTSNNASLGVFANSFGDAYVTGVNSRWEVSDGLDVGSSGQGMLYVGYGGQVVGQTNIGLMGSSSGTVIVDGMGSHLRNDGQLTVAQYGEGTLIVENGGKVTSGIDNYWGLIGFFGDSTGSVTVTGTGSHWDHLNALQIGSAGQGTLNVENGGKVTISDNAAYLGHAQSGVGTVTVTGENSLLKSNALHVGHSGDGTLNVQDSGKVDNVVTYLGDKAGSAGTAVVTGTNSRLENYLLYVGGNIDGAGGSGKLIINDGGIVSATGGVTIWSTGSLSGNGGTIEGDVINHGLISPGNSPGVLTITGDLTLESDSVLLMEIFGPTAYDQLIIGGNFVAGGILEFDFGGYMPEFDVPYDLFQVAGRMSGDFSEIKFLNPAAGFDAGLLSLSFAGGENGGMFQLIMANNGDPGNNTVPEPASGLLIGLGGLAMLMLRRRSPRISLA